MVSSVATASLWAQGNYTAASCNYNDVNAVVNGPTHVAVNGDTINVPAGTCTWSTNGLAVRASISIIGAGPGLTVLNDAIPTGASPCAMFSLTPSSVGGLSRLSGMTMQPSAGSVCPALRALGTCNSSGCTNLRVDNNTFSGWSTVTRSGNSYGITAVGDMFGLFDHNTINGSTDHYLQLVEFSHASFQGVGQFGDNSWHQPENYGSSNFLFIENNTFNTAGCCENEGSAGGYQNQGGGRVVVRFNQFNNMDNLNFSMGWHGTESSGRTRSTRAFEYYQNTFNCNVHCDQVAGARGGTGLNWGNTINLSGASLNSYFTLTTYRTQGSIGGWGACDGSSPWDANDNVVYYSGTVGAGGGSSTITVSGGSPGWSNNQWAPSGAPYSVHDVTQNTGSEIIANGPNTITVSYGGGPGNWLPNNGDTIQILRATACIDQAGGRGAGILYNPTNPATPTSPAAEALSPTYIWSNTFNGGSPSFGTNMSGIGTDTARVIRSRDFYVESTNQAGQSNSSSPFDGTKTLGIGHGTLANRPSSCTAGVGYWATDQGNWNTSGSGGQGQLYLCTSTNTWSLYYTPYNYPHPLIQGGGGDPPAPPTNLVATPQ